MRYLLILLISCCCFGCRSVYVSHDNNDSFDFDSVYTYNYDFGQDRDFSELDKRRFIKYSDSLLALRGLSKSETPDLWLQTNTNIFTSDSPTQLGVGVGSAGGNLGVSVGGGIPVGRQQQEWELTLVIIDAKSNTIVWEAYTESSRSLQSTPEKRAAHMEKVVAKLYSKYPPKN
ncbi:MAG: DUF4136 domain-containing protein [Dokdonia sp.]